MEQAPRKTNVKKDEASLEPVASSVCKRYACRRQMALDLLTGELRVLESAYAWLNNYCRTLRQKGSERTVCSLYKGTTNVAEMFKREILTHWLSYLRSGTEQHTENAKLKTAGYYQI
ncbi:unnamed protein product [Dovyalis caffra]|uniref:Transposase n=1 Tax=Dovyalis caffra TaxID=77055 RepID=A0AAV1QYF5_9ROSI|nr:unnamed protein product [Dovyalis caffra]